MSTIGLYLRMSQPEANAMRARLNGIAKEFGYTATGGPTTGDGNLSALLQAIDVGEVAVVLLPPDVVSVVEFLRQASVRMDAEAGVSALGDELWKIAEALAEARAR